MALAIEAGAVILVIIVMGIVLGYTGGISIDLANAISDPSFKNSTVNYINEAGNLGFSLLKFNFLTAIGMIAFATLGLFFYARREAERV